MEEPRGGLPHGGAVTILQTRSFQLLFGGRQNKIMI
jgi:hypothetical protein